PHPPASTLFPYTTLFRSGGPGTADGRPELSRGRGPFDGAPRAHARLGGPPRGTGLLDQSRKDDPSLPLAGRAFRPSALPGGVQPDRKSTRLNSSHSQISY